MRRMPPVRAQVGGVMRKAARKDASQTRKVGRLRERGLKVAITHRLGSGMPDILVGGIRDGVPTLLWVEIKEQGGSLTPDERAFFDEWAGLPVIVAHWAADVLDWFGMPVTKDDLV